MERRFVAKMTFLLLSGSVCWKDFRISKLVIRLRILFVMQVHVLPLFHTRNTCMQQPLALIAIQGTIFSEHEVFRVYDFEIVFIFTLSIFFKKCENNESIISFNYKIHNLHKFFSNNTINILIYCQI